MIINSNLNLIKNMACALETITPILETPVLLTYRTFVV